MFIYIKPQQTVVSSPCVFVFACMNIQWSLSRFMCKDSRGIEHYISLLMLNHYGTADKYGKGLDTVHFIQDFLSLLFDNARNCQQHDANSVSLFYIKVSHIYRYIYTHHTYTHTHTTFSNCNCHKMTNPTSGIVLFSGWRQHPMNPFSSPQRPALVPWYQVCGRSETD